VYNVKGERVRRLIDGGMEPGIHEVRWDGTSDSRGPVPSGIYFLRLACDELVETRQIVRLR
jgi:flagellar hook assembly protein FlgD